MQFNSYCGPSGAIELFDGSIMNQRGMTMESAMYDNIPDPFIYDGIEDPSYLDGGVK
jgi:hypothetical protein